MSLGNRLLEERLGQGYSLQQIEDEIKIRKFYIESLEREEFWNLPPRVYAVGFVRRYAKFLGLDEDEVADEFKRMAYIDDDFSAVEIKGSRRNSNSPEVSSFAKKILVAMIFLVAAIWVGDFLVSYFTSHEARSPQVEPPPSIEEPSSQGVVETEPESKMVTIAKVTIEARENCWLSVEVDGTIEYEGTLQAGSSKEFIGQDVVHVRAGNSEGITVTYNGTVIESLGPNRHVNDRDFPAAPMPED